MTYRNYMAAGCNKTIADIFIKPEIIQVPYMMFENNFRLFAKDSKYFFGII